MSLREITFNYWYRKYSAPLTPVDQMPHFVCFMDLLGSKANMLTDRDRGFVESLHAILNICSQINQDDLPMKVKTFSDNICLLYPIPKTLSAAKIAFKAFAASVASLQTLLLVFTGEWVRGGIAVGDAFADEHMVWGDALVRAADLEKKANIPLVEIDLPVVEKYVNSNCDGLVLRFGKTRPFINYFAVLTAEDRDKVLKLFPLQIKNKITEWDKPITLDAKNDKVAWVCAYYNAMAKKFGYDELKISFTIGDETYTSTLRMGRTDDPEFGATPQENSET